MLGIPSFLIEIIELCLNPFIEFLIMNLQHNLFFEVCLLNFFLSFKCCCYPLKIQF
jgi:hypothetical protein